jgi:hypothetical protein
VITSAFVLEALLVKPETYELYALTWHGFLLGLLAFLFGFTIVITGNAFWQTVMKWRWMFLSSGLICYGLRLIEFQLNAPGYLMAVESNVWIYAVFGFAYKHLNHQSKTLHYLSEAAYPVYIIHMFFLYLASFLIFPLGISATVKFIFTIALTGFGCFGLYEFVIRRIGILRPFFGLKFKNYSRINLRFMKTTILMILLLTFLNAGCKKSNYVTYLSKDIYKPAQQD